MKKKTWFVILVLIIAINISFVHADSRTALVIGNGSYKTAMLKNPVNDATDMARLLKKCGFSVMLLLNASEREMKTAVRSFGKKLRKNNGIGLFYFAGHGIQVKGNNFLIPIGTTVESEADVEFEALNAGLILGKMEDADNDLNIVILDACRNNPFARNFRSYSPGLARMDAPKGSLVAYSTAPGSVAADGENRNGIYTKYLLENMIKPNLTVEQVLKNVRVAVLNDTNNKQVPWESSSMTGDFYFAQNSTKVSTSSTKTNNQGKLSVISDPEGADIFLNNMYKGISPLNIKRIDTGIYTVKARLEGYDSTDKKIKVNSNRKAVVTFYFKKKGIKGKLYVTTQPSGCNIKIMETNEIYSEGMELDPGQYKVQVLKSGYKTKIEIVQIEPEEGIDYYIELEKEKVISKRSKSHDTWTEPNTGMEFVWVEGGCFQMGSDSGNSDEQPVHEVCLDDFWMAKYEVTLGQWKTISGVISIGSKNSGKNFPVDQVSWNLAKKFIEKLNKKSKVKFRLPTEAEWEYASRSRGKNQKFAGGTVKNVAWYFQNSGDRLHKIGIKAPNDLGLYDMSGNVWEWCEDKYDENAYSKHTKDNPSITTGSYYRVARGGDFYSSSENVRCTTRNKFRTNFRGGSWNFDPVLNSGGAGRGGGAIDADGGGMGFRLCSTKIRQ